MSTVSRRRRRLHEGFDGDGQAIAPSGVADDKSAAVGTVAKRLPESRNVEFQIDLVDDFVGPRSGHQMFWFDKSASVFEERDQDIARTRSDRDRRLAVQKRPTVRNKPKCAEGIFAARPRLSHRGPQSKWELRRMRCGREMA